MTEIALKIADQEIQPPEPRPRLVAGSAGVYAVALDYDAQWDDATVRVVVFDGGLCNQRVPVQDTSGTVTIPAECIAHGGRGNWLQIGVLGYDGTGTLRITTRAMLDGLRIDPAGASDADVPQDPPAATPGLWEKLVADVGNLSDLQTSDTSSLVAAINELAAKPAGYKPYPVTLTQNGNKWTADHTIAEVKEALAQGYSPYCVYNSWPVPCTGVEDNFVYYTGWLGNQTTAVWIMQSKSGVTVVARNTFGVDRLTNLVDSDGSFGGLNALIATNPRTAVVYNLGGTPSDGQDLSAMTFPALLWGTATDATARTQTFGLTGAGGDQWRVTQNFDTKAVTVEQVGADVTIDATLSVEGAAADAAAVGSALATLRRADVATVRYFLQSNDHDNDLFSAYFSGAPAAIVESTTTDNSMVGPIWVIFGDMAYGVVDIRVTDARGSAWTGTMRLSNYEIYTTPMPQTLNLTGVKKGQIPKITAVDDFGKPTAWEAADMPEADNSLGLSSATVGQTIKVKAVDTDGKPTEWEAVNLPSGGGETWEKVADITLTDSVNSVRATFDACSAVYVQLQWGGVESDVGSIYIAPNCNDTFYTGESRAAATKITTSTTAKRGYTFIKIDTRVGSNWTATSSTLLRGDGSFGAITPDEPMNCDIGVSNNFGISMMQPFYFAIKNEPLSNGVHSITAYGAGMAIGTTLKVWGIKK